MTFIKRDELLSYIDETLLNSLTLNDNTKLDKIEKFAISEIDGYIGGKYNTDELFKRKGNNRTPYLISIVIDIMLFHLYSRGTSNNIPEIKLQRYAKAVEYLENVGKGKISPNFPLLNNKFDKRSNELLFGGYDKINNSTL